MVKRVSHSGNLVKILSLGGCSSQNLVILAKSEPSGSFLDIENPAQTHSVTPRGLTGLTVTQLAAVCSELVEKWDDLAVFFGAESSGALMELRSVPGLNVLIFNDRLSRPQFAILSWLLDTGKHSSFFCVLGRESLM